MGSFSWLKADNLTNVSNIAVGRPFKFLIPKEFGGGYIEDVYQDYGYLGTNESGEPKYDMYELLAFWNKDEAEAELRQTDIARERQQIKYRIAHLKEDLKKATTSFEIECINQSIDRCNNMNFEEFCKYEKEKLKYNKNLPLMKEIDEYTDDNRSIGIDIGCYDEQIAILKYPLKLVSCEYEGNYEDLDSFSKGDPNQGFYETYR